MSRLAIRIVAALAIGASASAAVAGEPETVIITLQAKAGSEAALADVIARHFETANRLHLLAAAAPHLTLRSTDSRGRIVFTEILTWRDGETPDNAPAEIQSLWADMNRLVEARDSRPALTIVPVDVVTRAR